jgi:hypothetical protein
VRVYRDLPKSPAGLILKGDKQTPPSKYRDRSCCSNDAFLLRTGASRGNADKLSAAQPPPFQSFREQTRPLSIVPNDFYEVASSSSKNKKVAAIGRSTNDAYRKTDRRQQGVEACSTDAEGGPSELLGCPISRSLTRKSPRADRPSAQLARDHRARRHVEPRASRVGQLLQCRHHHDSDGKPLTGANKYVLHFAKNEIPPAAAFWSITLYDKDGFLTTNALDRHAIGDRDALKFDADGSLDLYFQTESPGQDKEADWLSAAGDFNLLMRLYAPKATALDGRWVPPPVKRVQ